MLNRPRHDDCDKLTGWYFSRHADVEGMDRQRRHSEIGRHVIRQSLPSLGVIFTILLR